MSHKPFSQTCENNKESIFAMFLQTFAYFLRVTQDIASSL